LAQAPDGRIQRSQQADLADRQAAADEQQRQQAPGEPVVEVVDQAGLAAGGQGRLAEAGADHDLAGGQPLPAGRLWLLVWAWVGVGCPLGVSQLGFQLGMPLGLVDQQRRQAEADAGVGQAEVERFGPQPGSGGDEAGEVGGEGDRQVAGGFVEAHGQPAALRSGQVDLHDDGGRPAQALVDPEQDVGGDDPAPGGRPDDQQRYG
jgi:hypothetical protein